MQFTNAEQFFYNNAGYSYNPKSETPAEGNARCAKALAMAEEAEGYCEWKDGATLIRDSYFKEYAQELAEDTGAINKDARWPTNCIDWEEAASELKQDYTEVDFDGVPYQVQNS